MRKQVDIAKMGDAGINTDLPEWTLSPGVIRSGVNFRCEDGYLKSFLGSEKFTDYPGADEPEWLMPVRVSDNSYWIVPGLTTVQVYDGTQWADISNANGYPNVTHDTPWSGGVFGTIPLLNNYADYPQYWDLDIANDLVDLPWDGATTWRSGGHQANILAHHKGFVLALGYRSGVLDADNYPYMVRWSDVAEPGTLPSTWVPAADNLAGFQNLVDESGNITCGKPMRDSFVVYKESGIWVMDYIGGQLVWSFRQLSETVGAVSSDAAIEIKGSHVVMGQDDIITHQGNSIESLVHKRVRSTYTSLVNPDLLNRSFAVKNPAMKEVWFCFCVGDVTHPNIALVWNWKDNTFGYRDLPETSMMAEGVETAARTRWSDMVGVTWGETVRKWGQRSYSAAQETLMGVNVLDNKQLTAYDKGSADDGVPVQSRVQRQNIRLTQDRDLATVVSVYPRMTGSGTVNFYIGQQYEESGPVTWEGPYSFDVANQRKIDCRVTGSLHAYRIESGTSTQWGITGMEWVLAPAGRR